MTTTAAPTTTGRPTLHLTNPPGPPTDQWIRAVARMLLSAADRQLAAEKDQQQGGAER